MSYDGMSGGQEAGQAGGSNDKDSKKNINISASEVCSQMLSLSLNLASNFPFFFSFHLPSLKTICLQFSANEMTEWGAYSKAHLKNCLLKFSVYPETILRAWGIMFASEVHP